jgi:hypothetical protein
MKAFYIFTGQEEGKKTNQQKKIALHWYMSKIQENNGRLSNEGIHTNELNRVLVSPIINST